MILRKKITVAKTVYEEQIVEVEETDVEMHTRRLKRLAVLLVEHDDSHTTFNMGVWGTHKGDHEPTAENFCGTTACALGHAAIDPDFRAEGLGITWEGSGSGGGFVATITFPQDGHVYTDDSAGREFFGLTTGEVSSVFLNINASKLTVIKQLLDLAENRDEVTGQGSYRTENWYKEQASNPGRFLYEGKSEDNE